MDTDSKPKDLQGNSQSGLFAACLLTAFFSPFLSVSLISKGLYTSERQGLKTQLPTWKQNVNKNIMTVKKH